MVSNSIKITIQS